MTTFQKCYDRDGYQYLERLRLTGPQTAERHRHTADPHARAYNFDLTFPEMERWLNGPEQVTRIE